MCEICWHYPCDPRCPNAADPPAVFVCSGCGTDIYEGDDYFEICGEQWCEKCVDRARRTAYFESY